MISALGGLDSKRSQARYTWPGAHACGDYRPCASPIGSGRAAWGRLGHSLFCQWRMRRLDCWPVKGSAARLRRDAIALPRKGSASLSQIVSGPKTHAMRACVVMSLKRLAGSRRSSRRSGAVACRTHGTSGGGWNPPLGIHVDWHVGSKSSRLQEVAVRHLKLRSRTSRREQDR